MKLTNLNVEALKLRLYIERNRDSLSDNDLCLLTELADLLVKVSLEPKKKRRRNQAALTKLLDIFVKLSTLAETFRNITN